MRKIIEILKAKYIVCALAFAVMFTACQDDDDVSVSSLNPVVGFVASSLAPVTEGEPGTLVVGYFGSDTLSSPVSVSYSITGAITQSGTVTIAEGELTADIEVSIPNDDIINDPRSFIATITSSDVALNDPMINANIPISDEITVTDDDFYCPRNNLTGITQGTDVGFSSADATIEAVGGPGDACLNFVILGGATSFGFSVPVHIPIVLVPDAEGSVTGTVADAEGVALLVTDEDGNLAETAFTLDISADGSFSGQASTFDGNAGTIGFDYNFYGSDGSFLFSGRLIYE